MVKALADRLAEVSNVSSIPATFKILSEISKLLYLLKELLSGLRPVCIVDFLYLSSSSLVLIINYLNYFNVRVELCKPYYILVFFLVPGLCRGTS